MHNVNYYITMYRLLFTVSTQSNFVTVMTSYPYMTHALCKDNDVIFYKPEVHNVLR